MPFSPKYAAAAACLALTACRQPAADQPANGALQNTATARPLPVAEPPLDRSALLIAAIRAASAYAAGTADAETQRQLDGKRFELRMRFGCAADAPDESRGWRFDEARRTLRLRVENDISADDPVVAGVTAENIESVEGLWLRRPWLLSATCPRKAPPAPEPEPGQSDGPQDVTVAEAEAAARRVGIAHYFTPADSRTARRDERPYEATKVLDEGQKPSEDGYDFVMSGRLRALPDGRVIACWSDGADTAPDCIIAVRLDRAWIELPGTKELLAEWHGS